MRRFNPRIVAAFVIGFFMVAGAFLLSKDKSEMLDPIVAVTTGEDDAPVRGFIPVNDNDFDGLPDWQNTFDIATVYVDEAPEAELTRTGALAVELATRTNTGGGDIDTILTDVGTALARDLFDKDYTAADIVTSEDNSVSALRDYGNQVAAIALINAPPAGTENELMVLNRALLRNDPSVLSELDPTLAAYEKMLEDMLDTTVPSSLTREHLALMNVYQALINDIKAFRETFNDALPAMSRFRRYQADVEALYTAIVLLYQKLDAEGIQWTDEDPVSKIIDIS